MHIIHFVYYDKEWSSDMPQKLTLSQMANFRLFQTGRVCRPQFKIDKIWQKVLQMEKRLWEKEKLLVTFFKRLVLQTCKNQGLFGKQLTHSHTMTPFDASGKKPFKNTVGKGEIARNEQFLHFPQCFLPVWITFFHFCQS